MRDQASVEKNNNLVLTAVPEDESDAWYDSALQTFLEQRAEENSGIQSLDPASQDLSQELKTAKYFISTGLLPEDYERPEDQIFIKIWPEETSPDPEERLTGSCHLLYREQHTLLQAAGILFPNDTVRDAVVKFYRLDLFYTGKIFVPQEEIQDFSGNQDREFDVIWPGKIHSIREIDTLYHVTVGQDTLVLIESAGYMEENLRYLLHHYTGSLPYLFVLHGQKDVFMPHENDLDVLSDHTPFEGIRVRPALRLDYYSGVVGDRFRLKSTAVSTVGTSIQTEGRILKIYLQETAGLHRLLVIADSRILWARDLSDAEIEKQCIEEDFTTIVQCGEVVREEKYTFAVEGTDESGNPYIRYLKKDKISDAEVGKWVYCTPVILDKAPDDGGMAFIPYFSTNDKYLRFIMVLQYDLANRYMKGEVRSYKFHKPILSVKIRLDDMDTPVQNVFFLCKNPVENIRYPMEYTIEEETNCRIINAAFDISRLKEDKREADSWQIVIQSEMYGILSFSYVYFAESFFNRLKNFFKLNNLGYYYKAENGNIFYPRKNRHNKLTFTFSEESRLSTYAGKCWRALRRPIRQLIYKFYHVLSRHVSVDDKVVIFISFHGRGYSDNPKAIYEAMRKDPRFADFRFIWFIKNHREKNIEIEGAEVKEYYSLPYFYYMSKAKYWVVNCKLPQYLRKKKKQIYLQTWHGTPLKRLAHDIEKQPGVTFYRSRMSYEEMLQTYDDDVARYTWMISPNRFCTDVFQSAFRIKRSRLIETGYPRNDFITNATPEDVIEIKNKYQIPLDKKVVLYAPTWRDDSYITSGYTFELKADFHYWQEVLGPDYVVVFKPHYLIVNQYEADRSLDGFLYSIDANAEINELYVISDILITDYSSVFFDYAVLNRPMYFYMYDLDDYRDQLRGFYLDIYTELPGKIYEEEKGLLEDVAAGVYDYDYLKTFNERFNNEQTGNCAEKVINIVFQDQTKEG